MFKNVFTEHPNSVNQTYLEHAVFALTIAGTCLIVTIVATVHSLLPMVFKNTGSNLLKKLNSKIEERDNSDPIDPLEPWDVQ